MRFGLWLLVALAASTTAKPQDVTDDDRETRLESETAEKEWVSTLAHRIASDTNVKAEVDPVAPTTQKTDASASEEDDQVSIECAYFDETACEKTGDCAITKKVCSAENHLKAVGCLAIFAWPKDLQTNTTDPYVQVAKVHFKALGCMQYQHTDSMSCEDPNVCRQGRTFRSGIGMCCCTAENCNREGNIEMNNPSLRTQDEENDALIWPTTLSAEDVSALDVSPVYWCVTVTLALILIIAIVMLVFMAWKSVQKKRKKKKFNTERTDVVEEGNAPLVAHEMLEMVVQPDGNEQPEEVEPEGPKVLPITDFKCISDGRFGKVFKAIWTENDCSRDVAVKKLSSTERQSFEAEKRIFDELLSLPKWYPSIVQFICAEQIEDEYWIVTEFHERLSLFELVSHNVISITSCNRIILTMIDGLQFLHDDRPFFFGHPKPPVIHRDIKSKNILVKRDMTACIADFGLARIYNFDIERSDLLGQVGTRRYMSPEVLEGATEFTANAFKAMDVYSMGLVMWEVISRTQLDPSDRVPEYQVPYQHIGANPAIGYMRNHVVSKKERPPWRPEVLNDSYMNSLVKVTEEMWEPEAFARITAGCAFARVWDVVMNSADNSEGYHSGGSTRGAEDNDDSRRNPEEIEEMVKYHEAPSSKSHPSPDPFLDDCPPPPPLPDIVDLNTSLDTEQLNSELDEQPEDDVLGGERVFDVAMNRLLTRQEQELWEAGRLGDEPADSRASTPTPDISF